MVYKDKLQAKKNELEEVIQERRDRLMTPITETTNELSMYDQHPADIGSEVYEREKDISILEKLEFEKEKLDDAIRRYEQGLYGVCDRCGKHIDPARLHRLVNTTLCTECAGDIPFNKNHRNYRPAEEDVLSISSMSDKGEAFQLAGSDFYEHE